MNRYKFTCDIDGDTCILRMNAKDEEAALGKLYKSYTGVKSARISRVEDIIPDVFRGSICPLSVRHKRTSKVMTV